MELPIDETAVPMMCCRHCLHRRPTVKKDELYCALRQEFYPPGQRACKKIDIDRAALDAERAPKPPPAAPVAPAGVQVVEVPGRYVWVGTDQNLIGKIIGREGRNIQALTEATRTTIEFIGGMAWVGGDDRVGESVAAIFLHAVAKTPEVKLSPNIVRALAMNGMLAACGRVTAAQMAFANLLKGWSNGFTKEVNHVGSAEAVSQGAEVGSEHPEAGAESKG